MKPNILIIEDESAIREMLSYTLTEAGYSCRQAAEVDTAQQLIKQVMPDLILLDWMLPGMRGIDYARILRKQTETQNIPIIILTARGEEADKVRGLDYGADDYITKPFSIGELTARIKAVLRRYQGQQFSQSVIRVKTLVLDPHAYRAKIGNEEITLSPTEFKLLHFFITHLEKAHNRARLLNNVWGTNIYVEERTVDVHIRRLRKALAPYGYDQYIQTVRGIGYRFSTQ